MNLYKVYCYRNDGTHRVELFIANSTKQAEQYGRDKHENEFYAYDADIVDNVDGYKITVSR